MPDGKEGNTIMEANHSIRKCLNCGHALDRTSEFCGYCGLKFHRLARPERTDIHFENSGPTGALYFVNLSSKREVRIPVHESVDATSRVLLVLGTGEPVPLIGEEGEWYEVLLLRKFSGYVLKADGTKREIASSDVTDSLGYFRLNTEFVVSAPGSWPKKLKSLPVTLLPSEDSETVATLEPWHCVPIVQGIREWFKVQLDDGVRGFVPVEYGIRTLRKDSLPLPKSPSERASILGGVVSLVGALAIGTFVAATREGLKEFD